MLSVKSELYMNTNTMQYLSNSIYERENICVAYNCVVKDLGQYYAYSTKESFLQAFRIIFRNFNL